MSIILIVMMISWGHAYAKCISFYTLNMYGFLIFIHASNHFLGEANAAGQGTTLWALLRD